MVAQSLAGYANVFLKKLLLDFSRKNCRNKCQKRMKINNSTEHTKVTGNWRSCSKVKKSRFLVRCAEECITLHVKSRKNTLFEFIFVSIHCVFQMRKTRGGRFAIDWQATALSGDRPPHDFCIEKNSVDDGLYIHAKVMLSHTENYRQISNSGDFLKCHLLCFEVIDLISTRSQLDSCSLSNALSRAMPCFVPYLTAVNRYGTGI